MILEYGMLSHNYLNINEIILIYSKTCLKRPVKKQTKIDFQDRLSLNAGQKYCRMLQREHSAILSTFINLPFVTKIFVLSILSGRLRQVLLYLYSFLQLYQSIISCRPRRKITCFLGLRPSKSQTSLLSYIE